MHFLMAINFDGFLETEALVVRPSCRFGGVLRAIEGVPGTFGFGGAEHAGLRPPS
jgi:hypothetical protein